MGARDRPCFFDWSGNGDVARSADKFGKNGPNSKLLNTLRRTEADGRVVIGVGGLRLGARWLTKSYVKLVSRQKYLSHR